MWRNSTRPFTFDDVIHGTDPPVAFLEHSYYHVTNETAPKIVAIHGFNNDLSLLLANMVINIFSRFIV